MAALGWDVEDRAKLRQVRYASWLSIVHSWEELRNPSDEVCGRLIVAADMSDDRLIQQLQWTHDSRAGPLFLATRFDPVNLSRLKDVVIDEVIRHDQ